MNINYIVKVEDAKPVDLKKALEQAGIKVRSIQETYKEKAEGKTGEETEEGGEKK